MIEIEQLMDSLVATRTWANVLDTKEDLVERRPGDQRDAHEPDLIEKIPATMHREQQRIVNRASSCVFVVNVRGGIMFKVTRPRATSYDVFVYALFDHEQI